MEDILNNDYGRLEQVLIETVQQVAATRTFNLMGFVQQMENEFIRLGFREKSVGGGVENILLVRLDHVGDFVLTSPTIRAVRENYPYAYITLVVSKEVYPLAELCPYVNEVLIFDINFDTSNILEVIWRVANFSKQYLWKRRYSLGFCFRYGKALYLVRFFMLYICGAKERVGYITDTAGIYTENPLPRDQDIAYTLLTHPVLPLKGLAHECPKILYILSAYGLKIRSADLELWYDSTDLYKAKKLINGFAENRLKIVVAVGSSIAERRYPIEKFFVALNEIISKGASIIILGGPSEVASARFLEENLPKEFVKNLVDVRTGWRVDAAIMSLADMYIGNFTGACDVASALKKPVIVMSRDSKEKCDDANDVFYPWRTNSIVLRPDHPLGDCAKKPDYNLDCTCWAGKPHCIAQIQPYEIVAAFDEMVHFMKHSGIKKIDCPPIIRNIDQMSQLQTNFEFKNVRSV